MESGTSQREIERITGIDRKMIRAYQKRFSSAAPATSPGVATRLPHGDHRHDTAISSTPGARDPNRKGSVAHAIGHTQATALKGRRFESPRRSGRTRRDRAS